MVILRTEFLAVGRIEGVAEFHLLPAEEVLHGTSKTAVAMEEDVEQHLAGIKALDIQRNIVVYLVDSQPDVQLLYLLTIHQHLDGSVVLTLLHGQQQILVCHSHALHGVALT